MKIRFNSFDIICGIAELQKLIGFRVNQIYDIDNKTYLIRFQEKEKKYVVLIESGIRFHTTAFDWPKNAAPSGFNMKLRKHLKNKRLEKVQQLGADRIVDFEFGTKEATYHLFLELYDRGNIVLTDHSLTILNILRPRTEAETFKFVVREKYLIDRAKEHCEVVTEENLQTFFTTIRRKDYLRRHLVMFLDCGPAVIEHVLTKHNLINSVVVPNEDSQQQDEEKQKKKKFNFSTRDRLFDMENDMAQLLLAIQESNDMLTKAKNMTSKGYIIQKIETATIPENTMEKGDILYRNIEYHPYDFAQFTNQPTKCFDTFLTAVDEFYSSLESQKIDMKTLQKEREAFKALSNVKNDHKNRLDELSKIQEVDKHKAELITANQQLVDNAILIIRSFIAQQISWTDIQELVKIAQGRNDPIASAITKLKLEINNISLKLTDNADDDDEEDDDRSDDENPININQKPSKDVIVDIDLNLSAWANARKYYDKKRLASQKEKKTIDASEKALKNAEKKTKQTLKEVQTISKILKARKVYWFEKFYWFISSENYLVIGGRDAQQNELIVKRYMRPSDIYVHAEIQGASSVVIRNSSTAEVPPKTLIEAGTMALSYSVAWEAKVITNVYWVKSEQVSKKAPTGEYLGTGSFMIRGKKNYLQTCNLIMGVSVVFKLEDSFIEKHRGERKVRQFEEEEKEVNKIDDQLQRCQMQNILQIESVEENMEIQNDITASFPDTEIKIKHETTSEVKPENVTQDNEEGTIIYAAQARRKQQQVAKKKKENKKVLEQQKSYNQENKDEGSDLKNETKTKRGQKGKLKKLKSKYKDQDEEERLLRMNLLRSNNINEKVPIVEEENVTSTDKEQYVNKSKKVDVEEVDDIEDLPTGDGDLDILDSLTGQPFPDDELLFALPVVAPYQALQNYKFKVKVIPGTGKRGKAAKTSLMMFEKDKLCKPREKDLFSSIKEDMLARNIPGNVKISVPHLLKGLK